MCCHTRLSLPTLTSFTLPNLWVELVSFWYFIRQTSPTFTFWCFWSHLYDGTSEGKTDRYQFSHHWSTSSWRKWKSSCSAFGFLMVQWTLRNISWCSTQDQMVLSDRQGAGRINSTDNSNRMTVDYVSNLKEHFLELTICGSPSMFGFPIPASNQLCYVLCSSNELGSLIWLNFP